MMGVCTSVQQKLKASTSALAQKMYLSSSFLGMVQYHSRFIRNLSTLFHPLTTLLQKGTPWSWTAMCEQAFHAVKQQLTSATVLTHYNPDLELRMAADASPYGVGAVLTHIMPDGAERPIAYASRTLTQSERNFAQLEREALVLIFGVKKFHQFLLGRPFILVTDHKPLLTILGPKKGVPTMAAARLQRWALNLSSYTYSMEFKYSKENATADALSRLPCPATADDFIIQSEFTCTVNHLQGLPVTAKQLASATRLDPTLSQVVRWTKTGWPQQCPDLANRPYFNRKWELSVSEDCLMWGNRVVIPPSFRDRLLDELHVHHSGSSRMKGIARSHFWWAKLDAAFEDIAKSCSSCQQMQDKPAAAPLHTWIWPETPWYMLHIDFAELDSKHFLVLVDAHSKWIEVVYMPSTTKASATNEADLQVLRDIFAVHGLPVELVFDNGPPFASEEFATFTRQKGIRHIRSPPFHPSTNGAAERAVKTFKNGMRKSAIIPLQHKLAAWLLHYRTTPHSITGQLPSELLMKRTIRTRFDLLHPHLTSVVAKCQDSQKQSYDGHTQLRQFRIGDPVLALDYRKHTEMDPRYDHTDIRPPHISGASALG